MRELLLTTNITREPGWLYFVGTNNDGKLIICRVKSYQGKFLKKDE